MKIYRTSSVSKKAQLNPDRDLTRVDLTYLRRISEEIAKNNPQITKMTSSLSEIAKSSDALEKIATRLGDINSTLKEIKSKIK